MDFYDLLGVRRGASSAELRRAFQKQARLIHPDLNPGDPVAADRFRAVSRAFEVLSDPQRRAEYDRGERPVEARSSVPDLGFEGFDFSAEIRAGGAGFRELIDPILGRADGEPEPSAGEDLEQATRVTFEESLRGARRHVHLVRYDPCPICAGAGDVAFGPIPCTRCRGTGQVRARRGHMIFSGRCPDCDATGSISRRPCARCAGEGRLIQSEWLDVQIPPGVGDGSRVRLPGCGNAGRRGGRPGDFVLAIQVEAHPFFRRQGEDLHCELPVTVTEAALGAHVEVPAPDGPVTIEIPAGTQTGQRFRLRKRGVPRLGEAGRGDLFVEARVVVPRIDDDRSRELLRELARLNPEDPRRDVVTAAASERKVQ